MGKLSWIISLASLFSLQTAIAQYVELTVDIETVRWNDQYKERPPGVRTSNSTVRCVVGADSWLIEQNHNGITQDAWWYTGSNIIAHSVVLRYPTERLELFKQNHPEIVAGRGYTKTWESHGYHGEPMLGRVLPAGGPGGTTELNLAWLAFCSGQYLKSEGRRIPAPSIEEGTMYDPYTDLTTTFKDELGLPQAVELYSTNQPLCHYRTLGSTNVLGWNFPLEFYMAQYRRQYPSGVWEIHMTASGKLTKIGPGSEPSIPTEAQRAAEK